MQRQDFFRGPWELRALHVEEVRDLERDVTGDFWIWFVARQGEDLWLAHGLSSSCTSAIADKVAGAIDGYDTDVLLTYLGETWAIIEALPVQHGQMQRDMVVQLEKEKVELERLRSMTRAEIEAERQRDEIESKHGPISPN